MSNANDGDRDVTDVRLPALIYDGDCGFCTRSVWLVESLSTQATLMPWQETDLAAFGIAPERAQSEVLWVDRSRQAHGGVDAVAALLRHCGGAWAVIGRLLALPPLRWVAAVVYRVVADNRHRLPGSTPACQLAPDDRPGSRLARDST